MKNKIFDTCVYPKTTSLKSIQNLSKKVKDYSILKACCMLSAKEKNYNLKEFYKNVKDQKNLIPVAGVKNEKNLKKHIDYIASIGYKFIKVHPRNLDLNIKENFPFYQKIFKYSKKNNLIIMWCTFDSWGAGKLPEYNQLELLTKLINKNKDQKIILMHGGGIDIMKYYERFRFHNNVYLDLSYTFSFFQNYSTVKDLEFVAEKFDRRILIGSDYPSLSLSSFLKNIKTKLKKLPKTKKKRIMFENMQKLIDEKE